MNKKLFSLSPEDKFKLNNKIFTVIRYFMKNMPIRGKCLHIEVKNEEGSIQWFTRDFDVETN